jgi:precorrin-6A/cobalt-precorrin-6A reductase
MSAQRLLILGGTGEAAVLARAAIARFGDMISVTTALAGRTSRPGPIPGQVRIGGFGGAGGLAAYLAEQGIDRVIDATHPFAVEISAHARRACERTGVPRLMLLRPAWRRHPLDRWIEVETLDAAVRLVDPPAQPLPLRFHEVVLGKGPFSLAEERHLMQRHGIEVLVCKASGGTATEAKLIAARELSLPVIMVRRPASEPGEAVETIEAALDWLADAAETIPAARRI